MGWTITSLKTEQITNSKTEQITSLINSRGKNG
jgi:hypothetical protein